MIGTKTSAKLMAYAIFTGVAYAVPHFSMQMENRGDKDATVSFKKDIGNVWLVPTLIDGTPFRAHQISQKYQVNIEPLDPTSTYDVIFSGQKSCTFHVGYFAPGNPKISVSGSGCHGGGYDIIDTGYTLLLYISDIRLKNK